MYIPHLRLCPVPIVKGLKKLRQEDKDRGEALLESLKGAPGPSAKFTQDEIKKLGEPLDERQTFHYSENRISREGRGFVNQNSESLSGYSDHITLD